MSRGYQPNPIAEHAACVELAAALASYKQAAEELQALIEHHAGRITMGGHAYYSGDSNGVRADVLANYLGISRSTFYRIARGDKQLGRL